MSCVDEYRQINEKVMRSEHKITSQDVKLTPYYIDDCNFAGIYFNVGNSIPHSQISKEDDCFLACYTQVLNDHKEQLFNETFELMEKIVADKGQEAIDELNLQLEKLYKLLTERSDDY